MARLAAVPLALALALAACGGSGGGGGPRTASPVPAGTPPGVTAFAQTVPAEDSLGEVFPGQANTWVLDRDFSLAPGYGLQYATALALFVGTPTGTATSSVTHASLTDDLVRGGAGPLASTFPFDQDAAEVTFLTPLFGEADGLRTAAVSDGVEIGLPALSGARSGYLNGTADSRLQRDLSLSAGTSYTLSWIERGSLRAGSLLGADAAPHAPRYRVVLRNAATGAVLRELHSAAGDFGTAAPLPRAVAIPAGTPGTVRLSFELRSAAEGWVVVDDVALADGAGPVAGFGNGDFEGASLAPWTAAGGPQSQNVRSGARDVAAGAASLRVTRTFHSPPSATWGRLVDLFENPSASPVSTRAVYLTTLAGPVPLAAPRAGGRALVGWDALGGARDVGLVFGSGAGYLDPASPDLFVVHRLDVPARGRVAVVHFVVQRGQSEGGPTVADVPAGTDSVAAAIANGFPAQEEYARDLEPGVREAVGNF